MTSARKRASSRDENEPDIIAAFEKQGWRVVRHTAYDFDTACPRCKMLIPIEVKNPKGRNRLTPSQYELVENGWPLEFVRSVTDVVAIVELHRRGCSTLVLRRVDG